MILSTKGLSHNLYKHFLAGSLVTVSPYKNTVQAWPDLLSLSSLHGSLRCFNDVATSHYL